MEAVRPETAGFSSARLQRIEDAMRRFVDTRQIAGAVTLLARQGRLVHFAAAGLMDLERGRPMEPDTIFRIASMTKPITTTAVLMLFEEGRFLLDDPVAGFLPEFEQTKVLVRDTGHGPEVTRLDRPITIRHLLTHTSGLTYDFYPDDPISRIYAAEQILRRDEALADKVNRLAAIPLVHQPGAGWTYSVSHDVLGRLVEVVSGQRFDAFLQQRIFGPLEMTDTGFFVPPDELGRLAPVYMHNGRGALTLAESQPDRATPPAFFSGGGGLVSTAADYGRFCQTLLNGGRLSGVHLLGRKTVEFMSADHWARGTQPYPPGFPVLNGYGFGLGVRTLVDVAQSGMPGSRGEYGWGGAQSTYFWIDPREQLFGVFMVQLMPLNFRPAWTFQVLAYQALVA